MELQGPLQGGQEGSASPGRFQRHNRRKLAVQAAGSGSSGRAQELLGDGTEGQEGDFLLRAGSDGPRGRGARPAVMGINQGDLAGGDDHVAGDLGASPHDEDHPALDDQVHALADELRRDGVTR